MIRATDTTLFHLAARMLGDARQWDRIARLNGLTDPIVSGTVLLLMPAPYAPQQRPQTPGSPS